MAENEPRSPEGFDPEKSGVIHLMDKNPAIMYINIM